MKDVVAPRISRQSAHEGGKVVGPTTQQPLPPLRYSFMLEAELTPAPYCGQMDRESNPRPSGLSRSASTNRSTSFHTVKGHGCKTTRCPLV